jgi:hypothetical protein
MELVKHNVYYYIIIDLISRCLTKSLVISLNAH